MSRDFGRVRRKPDGRWYVDLRPYGRIYSAHGARFAAREEAEAILQAVRVVVARGTPKRIAVDAWLPVSSSAHRVERWYGLWLARMRELVEAGERSQEYVDELERWGAEGGHVAAWWGARSVHEIDYPGLEAWGRWLAGRGLGAKTRHNVMAAVSSFLGWLRVAGEIDRVPPFPWPRVREHAPRLLSAEAQARVLAAIPEDRRGIFLALALLGLRPSEAARLRAADYAPGDPPWLTVARTKNGDVKRLPVPVDLAAWIEAHVPAEARLRGAPLFALPYTGRGKPPRGPWSGTSLRREWSVACAACGESVSLYEGTKHSRATDLLRQGVPERVLQALLGHRDARSTRRYARLSDQALVEALRPASVPAVSPVSDPPRKGAKP